TIDPGVPAVVESAGFPIGLGSVPYVVGTKSALAKIDHAFHPSHRLAFRAHLSKRVNQNVEPFGGIVAGSHGVEQQRTDWGVAAAVTDLFGPRAMNEVRLLLVRGDQAVYGMDPLCGAACRDVHDGGPEVTLPGLAVFGRQLNTPQIPRNLAPPLAGTPTPVEADHTLKA